MSVREAGALVVLSPWRGWCLRIPNCALAPLFVLLFACNGKPHPDRHQDSAPNAESDMDTDSDTDTDSDADTDADSDITFDTALPETGSWRQVSVGGFHACGIRADGSLVCWGDNQFGQCDVPPGTYSKVSLDYLTSCAILDSGEVYCWGLLEDRNFPGGHYVALDGYLRSYCALRDDGAIDCWGRVAPLPTEIQGNYTQIGMSRHSLCALGGTGSPALSCWGAGDWWELPTGGPYLDLCVGETFGCVLDADRELVCFGSDDLYNGAKLSDLARLGPFLDISCVDMFISAIDHRGQLFVLPDGFIEGSADTSGPFVRTDIGNAGVCGLARDGSISCWGRELIEAVPE